MPLIVKRGIGCDLTPWMAEDQCRDERDDGAEEPCKHCMKATTLYTLSVPEHSARGKRRSKDVPFCVLHFDSLRFFADPSGPGDRGIVSRNQ